MKKYENGKYVELPPEEISAMQSEARKIELMEKSRPMTESEVTMMLITQQVNSLVVDNNTALRMKEFYPSFKSIIGQTVTKGFKFTHEDKLWEVVQATLTFQSHYTPGVGTESLYAEVCETHEGTEDDPIPYEGNMALENGKHYMQEYEVYRCTTDTINPVYHALHELVGLYVEKV